MSLVVSAIAMSAGAKNHLLFFIYNYNRKMTLRNMSPLRHDHIVEKTILQLQVLNVVVGVYQDKNPQLYMQQDESSRYYLRIALRSMRKHLKNTLNK